MTTLKTADSVWYRKEQNTVLLNDKRIIFHWLARGNFMGFSTQILQTIFLSFGDLSLRKLALDKSLWRGTTTLYGVFSFTWVKQQKIVLAEPN